MRLLSTHPEGSFVNIGLKDLLDLLQQHEAGNPKLGMIGPWSGIPLHCMGSSTKRFVFERKADHTEYTTSAVLYIVTAIPGLVIPAIFPCPSLIIVSDILLPYSQSLSLPARR